MRFLIGTVLLLLALAPAFAGAADDSNHVATRAAYGTALTNLNAGRMREFQALRDRLADYVLQPYLDYHSLSRRLDHVGEEEIRAFHSRHGDLPVTALLYRRWLARLGERADWATLARNPPEGADPAPQCLYLRARVETGAAADAFDEVAALWTVGHSQPRACDPLFERWIAAGKLSPALARERLERAVDANETALARYLLRFLQGESLRFAEALVDVQVKPATVLEPARFLPDCPESRVAVAHGLRRLAAEDPDRARGAWVGYRASHRLTPEQNSGIAATILLAEGRMGRLAEPWPADLGTSAPDGLARALAQMAVNRQQWDAARYWIGQLGPEAKAETRWRYWWARAREGQPDGAAESAAVYASLAGERDYYGFLAAARAGLPPRLNQAPHEFDPAVDARVRALPAVQRALELYAVGDLVNARREWFALVPGLDPDAQVHAAYIARESGWIPQSIQIANTAMLRDHVDLRFPVIYPEVFSAVSRRTAVAEPFLLAIARQESLFDASARSAADARGVMQLLPGTATEVARLADLAPPRAQQLHEPTVNVELGGRYLARLLDRYGDQRPLAAAAYNAGPGRVDRWVSERAGEPTDIWIENIPFGETRNYVKNVLAFTQVYGQLLAAPLPMLGPHESVVR